MDIKQLEIPEIEKLLLNGLKVEGGFNYQQKVDGKGRVTIIAVKRPPEKK